MNDIERIKKAAALAAEAAELVKYIGLEDEAPAENVDGDDERLNEAWDMLDSAAGILSDLADAAQ